MLLKRKRSDSELSFSSCGTLSSPPRPNAGAAFGGMGIDFSISPTTTHSRAPAHLPSRTMKRFRDSRPPEEQVHQHTLQILYSAAQQQQHQPPQHLLSPPAAPVAAAPAPSCNQPSLHSFWNLPGAATSSPSTPSVSAPATPTGSVTLQSRPTTCEDCGSGLVDDGGSMDIDSYGHGVRAGEDTCGACGKAVCFSCSISNLGDQRRCLACAGRKA